MSRESVLMARQYWDTEFGIAVLLPSGRRVTNEKGFRRSAQDRIS
jgi:hypothetical protein